MSTDAPEGTHVCVRCGNANGGTASFCVECGFDLSSALQRDYDSYRDVSRGDLTLSESDQIPVAVIRTLTGMPSASGGLADEQEGISSESTVPPPESPQFAEPAPPEATSAAAVQDTPDADEDEAETRIEVSGIELPEGFAEDEEDAGVIPLEMEQIDDPFAPGGLPSHDAPKSRPVHENLREGVTTYVHASERSFRRPGAPEERTSLAISVGSALAIGAVILVLILVLTR
jgi:hypothetical protein